MSSESGTGASVPPSLASGVDALALPHDKIPFWSREKVYDTVTSMYLDCWDDGEIARELSAELKMDISPHLVAVIRGEAATAAEGQAPELRKKWVYRYRKLTVNNLVKEFMFIDGSRNFIAAKRTLAKEIETLARTTPPTHLCIAVNDAVGRNNVGLETILELETYARRAEIMDRFVDAYGMARAMSAEKAMHEVSARVNRAFNTECCRNYEKAVPFMKKMLGQQQHPFEPADVDYFLEYEKTHGEDNDVLIARLVRGADITMRPKTAIETAIDGAAQHMTPNELNQITDTIRSSAVMGRADLDQIMDYAIGQREDVAALKAMGKRSKLPPSLQAHEQKALENLISLVARHLLLLDRKKFFTAAEAAKAARSDISSSDLQIVLDRLNALTTPEEVGQLAEQMFANRRFEFPLKRYLNTRFHITE